MADLEGSTEGESTPLMVNRGSGGPGLVRRDAMSLGGRSSTDRLEELMTRSHLPPHRYDSGGMGVSRRRDGSYRWLRPLGYGAASWGLLYAMLIAGAARPGTIDPRGRLLGLLPILVFLPVIAALGLPSRRQRTATIVAHLALAGGLVAVSLLLSPTAGELPSPSATATAIIGLAGYGLVFGGTMLGWRHVERQESLVELARAEDAATRAQLNPHFLFNTLHSLATMVRHDPGTAADAIAVLGRLLRYVLDPDAAGDVPLRREWEFVEGYLQLERLRLGDRLAVDLQIDPETLALPIPSLCLQPLVENAVRHGIGPQPEGGRVTVAVQLRNESLVIRVSDTGAGTVAAAVGSAPGLGLRAIRQRIESRFHGSARLELASSPGRGFTAELRFPVDTALPRPRHLHDRGHAHRR